MNRATAVIAVLLKALSPEAARAVEEDPRPSGAKADLFSYDSRADLGVKEIGVEKHDAATVHDITFAAAPDRTIKAYLVMPEGKGPFAGVLWVHWLGEPETTNRGQYRNEAVALAAKGIASLLVDAMWSAPGWYEARVPENDRQSAIQQVVALRRAMDLLASQPSVDKARLGFVGHDYGGMYGMLMAGADRRARTYVYVAVAPSLHDWAFFARQPRSKAEYVRQNAPLELTDSLRQVGNASTLFQFATCDVYVSRAGTAVLLAAAGEPKERRFYEADHSMQTAQIAEDRDAWLVKELATPAVATSPAVLP